METTYAHRFHPVLSVDPEGRCANNCKWRNRRVAPSVHAILTAPPAPSIFLGVPQQIVITNPFAVATHRPAGLIWTTGLPAEHTDDAIASVLRLIDAWLCTQESHLGGAALCVKPWHKPCRVEECDPGIPTSIFRVVGLVIDQRGQSVLLAGQALPVPVI